MSLKGRKIKSQKTTYNPKTRRYTTKTTYEKKSRSSRNRSHSSGGSSSNNVNNDSKLQKLKKLQSSLKPGTFAYKQLTADINKRYSQLTGTPYVPSEVVLSKSNPKVGNVKFKEETFAATKAGQQAMARTQQRTQESLFKKFNLPGQLEREQAQRNVANFRDVQQGRLGVIDTDKGVSRKVTPFEAASIKRQLAGGLLSSQLPSGSGKIKTPTQVASEQKNGEKVIFSTRSNKVLGVQKKPVVKRARPVPSGAVSVYVSKSRLASALKKGPNEANKLLKQISLKATKKAYAKNPVTRAVLDLAGSAVTKLSTPDIRAKFAKYYAVATRQDALTRNMTSVQADTVADKYFEDAISSFSDAVAKKYFSTPALGFKDVVDVYATPSGSLKVAYNVAKKVINIGVRKTGGLISLGNHASVIAVNNINDATNELKKRPNVKNANPIIKTLDTYVRLYNGLTKGPTAKSFSSAVRTEPAKMVSNVVNAVINFIESGAIKTSEGQAQVAFLVTTLALAELAESSSSGGKVADASVMESKFKSGLKKPTTTDVKLSRVGEKVKVEKVGVSEFKGEPVIVKETRLVSKVTPADIKQWYDYSDYKFVGKSVKGLMDVARKVKEIPGKISEVTEKLKSNVGRVKTRVMTKTREVPVSKIVRVENPETGEFFTLTKSSIKVEQIPLAERLYLNKFVSLSKEAKENLLLKSREIKSSVSGAVRKSKSSLRRVVKRVRTKEEVYAVGGEPVLRKVPTAERFFLDKPLDFVKTTLSKSGKKITKSFKQFVSSSKKLIDAVRRKKILKVGKEVLALRDQQIIDRVSIHEQVRLRARKIIKSLAKSSSKVKTSKTPYRVVLPKVGARYITTKLFRRMQSYKQFVTNEFGDSLGTTISENFKRAGLALKRFDANMDKLIVDLDNDASIKPTNEALRALKKFKRGISKSERKVMRKSILEREASRPVDIRETTLRKVKLQKDINKAFLDAQKLEKVLNDKGGIPLKETQMSPKQIDEFLKSQRAELEARRIKRLGSKKALAKAKRKFAESQDKGKSFFEGAGKKKSSRGPLKNNDVNEVDTGRQILLQKKESNVVRESESAKVTKPTTKKSTGVGGRLPSSAVLAAVFASPKVKSAIAPILFPQLSRQKSNVLQSLLNPTKSISLQSSSLSQIQKQRQVSVSKSALDQTSVLDSVLKPTTKTALATGLITSSALLFSQVAPLVNRGSPVFGSLRDKSGSINTIHTSRLKGVNYGYLADLYSVIYGDVATAKQKAALTKSGRKFTGLEARKLLRRKK